MGAAQHDKLSAKGLHRQGLEALSWPPEDMLAFRRDFVIKMGWFDEAHTDDTDRYDHQDATVHLVNRDDDGEVLSGMRLTKLDSFDDSLSVEMLRSNELMHETAVDFGRMIDAEKTDMWDLTRLVHRLEGEPRFGKSIASILAVFGAGLAKTMPRGEHELAWVFTTTEPMKYLLDGSGIEADVIAQGKIAAHDEQDSYFCVIYPAEAMRVLRENQDVHGRTYDIVNSGFQSLVSHE